VDDPTEPSRPSEPPHPSAPPFPVAGSWYGHPYPNLGALPKEAWRDALLATHHSARGRAAETTPSIEDYQEVITLIAFLGIAISERGDAARQAGLAAMALPVAAVSDPPRYERPRDRPQVNVRLRRAEHATLIRAAELMATKPTSLARLFIVRGARAALREVGELPP
jgi:hypothetical protein